MFKQIFLIISIFLCSVVSFAKPLDKDEQKIILAEVNAYRFQHSLSALQCDDFISKVAVSHSLNMAKGLPFGHAGFDQRSADLFLHFKAANAIAENVAYASSMSAKGVVKLWLESLGHRKNIEGNYNLTGIGIAQSKDGRFFVTQIFLKNK